MWSGKYTAGSKVDERRVRIATVRVGSADGARRIGLLHVIVPGRQAGEGIGAIHRSPGRVENFAQLVDTPEPQKEPEPSLVQKADSHWTKISKQ